MAKEGEVSDDDLVFQQIREQSPQWRVLLDGREVALVTEGWFFKSERYTVRLNDGRTSHFVDRADVVSWIAQQAGVIP